MTINTLTNLPPEVAVQFCMRLLARPMPDLVADVGNYHVSMEQNQGNILEQSRYDNLPTQPVPLGPSGINPAPMVLNRLDIQSELNWYGKPLSAVLKSDLNILELPLAA